jgi:subtilisin-like proprotein convertase family protein
MTCRVLVFLLAGAIGLNACGPTEEDLKAEDGEDGKADAWNYSNDPDRFRVEFNYRLADLPRSGEAEAPPWPDDYWAYYNDSINYRWRGESNLSPAELYDRAFNNWTPAENYMSLRPRADRAETWDSAYYTSLGPLAAEVHTHRGNADMVNGVDDDSDGQIDECGDEECDGVEFWWGVCHAWTPSAILEPEPINPVTHNGQTFYPSDIKALMMIAYDSSSALMLGGRCNAKDVTRDEFGRSTSAECQDVNAGAFHVVITNLLGLQRRALAEDRTYDYQVWNQPMRSYEITTLNTGLTAAQAMTALGRTGATYAYNADARSFAEVRMSARYITEASPSEAPRIPQIDRYTRTDRYHYILELDANGNIIGGEWGPTSQSNHPDFLWLPTGHGTSFRNLTYANVRMLLDMSRRTDAPVDGDGQVFEVRPNAAIPDNSATGVTVPLSVTADGTIQQLSVAVDIQHTYIGDLTLKLRHNGTEVSLQRHQGGSADSLVQNFTVADFNGQSISGTWELFVSDDAAQDTGTVQRFALVAVLGDGGTTPPSNNTFSSTTAVSIPDNSATGATSAIDVTGTGSIGGLSVRVDIAHTYIGDLIVELRHNGQVRRLHNRTGGGTDNLQSEFQVTEFNGTSMGGRWELFVSDNARSDTGRINSWSLTFAAGEAPPVDPVTAVAPNAAGQIVFSEIMADPAAVSDTNGEWFEVYNTTTDRTFTLQGAIISDDDGESFTVEGNITIGPGERLVFARSQEMGVNGGVAVNYAYGTAMNLANSGDELVLTVGGTQIDRVAYGSGWPRAAGAALQLGPANHTHTANDSAASWCLATQAYGSVSDKGTPGRANTACP